METNPYALINRLERDLERVKRVVGEGGGVSVPTAPCIRIYNNSGGNFGNFASGGFNVVDFTTLAYEHDPDGRISYDLSGGWNSTSNYIELGAGLWLVTYQITFATSGSDLRMLARLYNQTDGVQIHEDQRGNRLAGTINPTPQGSQIVRLTGTKRLRVDAYWDGVAGSHNLWDNGSGTRNYLSAVYLGAGQ